MRGVGEWTAQYIALRAAREPDAFPASDAALLRGATGSDGSRPSPGQLLARAERWRPWRAYAAQHLLGRCGVVAPSGLCGKRRAMSETLRLFIDHIDTPLGRLAVVADEGHRLRAVGWTDGHARMERQLSGRADPGPGVALVERANPGGLSAALRAYFDGDLAAIDRLPVVFDGTEFQRRVWAALREIPCGETCSYGDLALRIGNPKAVRAVGLANGANPIGIVVPCHRVIGADGSLTGYGGGVERKNWLLEHERRARVHSHRRLG